MNGPHGVEKPGQAYFNPRKSISLSVFFPLSLPSISDANKMPQPEPYTHGQPSHFPAQQHSYHGQPQPQAHPNMQPNVVYVQQKPERNDSGACCGLCAWYVRSIL